jgi:hypothetical protein
VPVRDKTTIVMRIISVLNRLTVALAGAGFGLVVSGFVTVPLLGYTAATVTAVGTWLLSLAALNLALLLLTAVVGRIAMEQWYWGESPQRAFSRMGWLVIAIIALGVVIVVIVLDW